MAGKIKITMVTLGGVLGIVLWYAEKVATTGMTHLITLADCYSRLAIIRAFEVAYRLYSLPV
jgi:hypothetical protein